MFKEAFPRSQANFYNAYDLYDYAAYHWNHETSTALGMTSHDLETLRELAWEEQSLKYGHLDDARNDLTSAIAGRTLASRVTALFSENIKSRGKRNKLNLAFTSHKPFLDFFALAKLTTEPFSHLFSQLPEPGATLTFELFSIDEASDSYSADSLSHTYAYDLDPYNNDAYDHADSFGDMPKSYSVRARRGHKEIEATLTYDDTTDPLNDQHPVDDQHPVHFDSNAINDNTITSYPETDRLYVRFLYYSNSNNSSRPEFTSCPLFGNTHSAVPFKHFNATVSAVGISDVASWCTACESRDTVFFCKDTKPRTKKRSHHITIALAGSAVALAAVLIILLLIVILTVVVTVTSKGTNRRVWSRGNRDQIGV